jgi:hypothetical protein
MSLQYEVLAGIIQRERLDDFSATEKNRSAARLLQEQRCCVQASRVSRLRTLFGGGTAACCAAG